MFASTPDDGEVEGRFNKFKKSIGKFRDDYKKNRCQSNWWQFVWCNLHINLIPNHHHSRS